MEVRSSFPILSTRDLPRLESFYRDAFGAERTYAFEAGGRDVYVALCIAEPDRMPWGERVAQVRDPGGFVVHLAAESD